MIKVTSSNDEQDNDEKEILVGRERRKENILVPYPILGIIFAIVVQSMGALWWASGFSSSVSVKLDYLQKTQAEVGQAVIDGSRNRYSLSDASRDWSFNDKRLTVIESELEKLKDWYSNLRHQK